MEVIEGPVTLVKIIRRDLGNALHRAGNVNFHRVSVVKRIEQVEHHAPLRVIVIHADLLADDALLLAHRLLREIRFLHEIEQDLQRLIETVCAGEQIAGAVKGRIGIGGGTRFGIALKRVPVFALKQFVLEIMRDALRHGAGLLALHAEGGVNRTVMRAEHGIGRTVVFLRIEQNPQAGGVIDLIIVFPHPVVADFPDSCAHTAAPFPTRQ